MQATGMSGVKSKFFEGDKLNLPALKNLVRAAIAYNQTKLKKNAKAKARKPKKA